MTVRAFYGDRSWPSRRAIVSTGLVANHRKDNSWVKIAKSASDDGCEQWRDGMPNLSCEFVRSRLAQLFNQFEFRFLKLMDQRRNILWRFSKGRSEKPTKDSRLDVVMKLFNTTRCHFEDVNGVA